MKCPDCEMEVESLTRAGICKKCSVCKAQIKYVNKLNNTNKPYIPVKELKKTDMTTYQKIMSRRKTSESNKTSKTNKSSKSNKTSKNKVTQTNTAKQSDDLIKLKQAAKDEVKLDIINFRKQKDIKEPCNYLDLSILMNWLNEMLKEVNYFKTLDSNRQLYDTLILDYLHIVKPNNRITDLNDYAKLAIKQEYLQQERTPVCTQLNKYKIVEPFFDKLKEDSELSDIFHNCMSDLIAYDESNKNPKYKTSTISIQDNNNVEYSNTFEFRTISKPHQQNKYSARISKVMNLYNNPNYQPFVYKGAIYADSEEEAKEKLLEFIKEKFPSLTYNTKDIEISLYTERGEL